MSNGEIDSGDTVMKEPEISWVGKIAIPTSRPEGVPYGGQYERPIPIDGSQIGESTVSEQFINRPA